jgi:hypothetical protein
MARPIRLTNLPGVIRGSGESPTGRHSFAAEFTFSGQNGIRVLLDMMSDNPGNDRQADQLDSQPQATGSQRHTPACAEKVASCRLSSLDDTLELRRRVETSIPQLKYPRASLAKWMHSSPDSRSSAVHLTTSIRGPAPTTDSSTKFYNCVRAVRPVRNR